MRRNIARGRLLEQSETQLMLQPLQAPSHSGGVLADNLAGGRQPSAAHQREKQLDVVPVHTACISAGSECESPALPARLW
jgi:hypothetical protein